MKSSTLRFHVKTIEDVKKVPEHYCSSSGFDRRPYTRYGVFSFIGYKIVRLVGYCKRVFRGQVVDILGVNQRVSNGLPLTLVFNYDSKVGSRFRRPITPNTKAKILARSYGSFCAKKGSRSQLGRLFTDASHARTREHVIHLP